MKMGLAHKKTGSMTDSAAAKKEGFGIYLKRCARGSIQAPGALFCRRPRHALARARRGIYEGEALEQALFREIREETGLVNPRLLRKLGVDSFLRANTHTNIERHNYLLRVPSSMPDTWEHRATGGGNDAGKRFIYQWIGIEDLDLVDDEFRSTITPENIPELFVQAGPA